MVTEGLIHSSPMESISAPLSRPDQIQPFTHQQIKGLLAATRRTKNPRREEALILFLLDTGVRVSELCALRLKHLDMQNLRCTVLGKGQKSRSIGFGRTTAKALWQYLRQDVRENNDPLFMTERSEAFSRSGLQQLIERMGKAAGLQAVRCSPHTFRHTFAVEFLRDGGNVFTLKELLGHTTLSMVNRYVAFAQADIENAHREHSPADRLKRS
jgi:integrase/recombinase XerC/integrase/recombinase XerD